ncbi:hypothetical protein DERP_015333 [Dermatophagoides pteronyssinus]|uniref:Uncharacterized protein n=1 Tax=Dermatophagoides pteronyssinus TaxID=6956 RepID=A0ABQ8IRL3_DERPT|nr:hypothetical protein DERP_015333 [Dermatophagoides pteronyssinus]
MKMSQLRSTNISTIILVIIFIVHCVCSSYASPTTTKVISKKRLMARMALNQQTVALAESIKTTLKKSETMLKESPCNGHQKVETVPESGNIRNPFWKMIMSDERAYLKSLEKRLKYSAEHLNNPFLHKTTEFAINDMELMMKFFPFLCDLINGDEDDDNNYFVGLSGLSDAIDELVEGAEIEANFLMHENRRSESDQIYDRSKFLRDRLHDLQQKKLTDNPQDIYNALKNLFIEIAKFEHFVLDLQKHFSVNYANIDYYNY